MSKESLLQETKTQVRCTLVSNPGNMTVRKLHQDYLNLIGEPIPYVRLGYRSLIEFLREIPDVVKVTGRDPMGATLTPVITKTLESLNSLIMKQKLAKTKHGPVVRRQTVVAPTDFSRPTESYSGASNSNEPEWCNNPSAPRSLKYRSKSRTNITRNEEHAHYNQNPAQSCKRTMTVDYQNKQQPSSLSKEKTLGNDYLDLFIKQTLLDDKSASANINRIRTSERATCLSKPELSNNSSASRSLKNVIRSKSLHRTNNVRYEQHADYNQNPAQSFKRTMVVDYQNKQQPYSLSKEPTCGNDYLDHFIKQTLLDDKSTSVNTNRSTASERATCLKYNSTNSKDLSMMVEKKNERSITKSASANNSILKTCQKEPYLKDKSANSKGISTMVEKHTKELFNKSTHANHNITNTFQKEPCVKGKSENSKGISIAMNAKQSKQSTCANNKQKTSEKEPYLEDQSVNSDELSATKDTKQNTQSSYANNDEPKISEQEPYLKDKSANSNEISATLDEKQTDTQNDEISTTPIMQPDVSHQINNKIRSNLKELIKTFPNGLRMTDLAFHYEKYCGKSLVYENMGFVSEFQFCLQLSDIFSVQRLAKSGDFILFDATVKISPQMMDEWTTSYRLGHNVQKPTERVAQDNDIEEFIPNHEMPDMVGPCDDIESVWNTAKFVEGKKLKIVITKVYDPTKFWFVIYDDGLRKLNLELENLGSFYDETQKGAIPKDKIQYHMFYAAYLKGSWHRILAIQSFGENRIKAFFVDSGSIDIVDISSLRFLPKSYQSLAKAALRGRLDYILPANREKSWSSEVTREFIRRIRERVLTVCVTEVDEKGNVVWMVVRFTDDANSVTLNEELVENGQADLCPVSCWMDYCTLHFMHLNIREQMKKMLIKVAENKHNTSLDEFMKPLSISSLENHLETYVPNNSSGDDL